MQEGDCKDLNLDLLFETTKAIFFFSSTQNFFHLFLSSWEHRFRRCCSITVFCHCLISFFICLRDKYKAAERRIRLNRKRLLKKEFLTRYENWFTSYKEIVNSFSWVTAKPAFPNRKFPVSGSSCCFTKINATAWLVYSYILIFLYKFRLSNFSIIEIFCFCYQNVQNYRIRRYYDWLTDFLVEFH